MLKTLIVVILRSLLYPASSDWIKSFSVNSRDSEKRTEPLVVPDCLHQDDFSQELLLGGVVGGFCEKQFFSCFFSFELLKDRILKYLGES